METWIIYVVAPIAVAVVSWMLGKNGRRIDETSKLVALLQEEIARLTAKVAKLEEKVEVKERESERKSGIIQEAFRCKTPSARCPVLLKLFENNERQENEQRIEKLQSGEYPPECDQVQRGSSVERPGL
jgi:cell division protein FtsB|nr:MAG TPA: shock protein B [Caudoviricetes sp.]